LDTPSIGRIVHYVEVHGKHHAALVTDVAKDDASSVDLAVFHSQLRGTLFLQAVRYSWPPEGPNTWHWPERV